MTRIAAVGGYLPRFRLGADAIAEAWDRYQASGIDAVAVPDADEDAVTMAHAAARQALAVADRDAGSVARLHVGTTTPPLAEGDLMPRLCSTLGLPEGVMTATHTGSTRAGVEALLGGYHADETALVLAADCPRGDPDSRLGQAAGAGAAAVLLAPEGGAPIVETASHVEAYPGTRYRPPGETETRELGVRTYERDAYRETLSGAIDRLDTAPGTVDAAALQAPDGDRPYRVADALGIAPAAVEAGVRVAATGDLGAASPVFGLVAALADGVDRVLVAGYGGGAGATALLVDTEDPVPAAVATPGPEHLSYTAAMRRRGAFGDADVAGGGAHVSLPSWRRTLPQRHRLEAGACRSCSAVAFPPAGACQGCGATEGYDPVTLPTGGEVVATTTIHPGGAPPEFADQQRRGGVYDSAIVAFEADGGRTVRVPVQVVVTGDRSIAVGDPVETTVRRIYTQEGVPRYGVKAVPAEPTG
ncbi:MAG: ACP synthase [Halobacteriaceae archaeon]